MQTTKGNIYFSDVYLGETTTIQGRQYRYVQRTMASFFMVNPNHTAGIGLPKIAFQYEPVETGHQEAPE